MEKWAKKRGEKAKKRKDEADHPALPKESGRRRQTSGQSLVGKKRREMGGEGVVEAETLGFCFLS